jgi:retron-type reverse transcriptase
MAHTVNRLWEKVLDFENVYLAYKKAASGKRYREEVLSFAQNLEENLFSIIRDMREDAYAPLPLRQFQIYIPKKRLISAPAFRDRVVHHAVTRVIEPVFETRFTGDSFACRAGRGTHAAMRRVLSYCRKAKRLWGNYYVLKCDIRKFFPSVSHEALKRELRRSLSDKRLLRLLDVIIDGYGTDGQAGVGIPIGALTSQLFANISLDPLDHYLKERLGIRFYARYMDDFVIIHQDKAFLRDVWGKISAFLAERRLALNPKTAVFQAARGIDFCGYRIWATHVKPRKTTIKRAKRRLRKYALRYRDDPAVLERAKNSLASFFGYVRHCSGFETTNSILEKVVFRGFNPALPDTKTSETAPPLSGESAIPER